MPEIGKEIFNITYDTIKGAPKSEVNFIRAGERTIYYISFSPNIADLIIRENNLESLEDAGLLVAHFHLNRAIQLRSIGIESNFPYLNLPRERSQREYTLEVLQTFAQDTDIHIFIGRDD